MCTTNCVLIMLWMWLNLHKLLDVYGYTYTFINLYSKLGGQDAAGKKDGPVPNKSNYFVLDQCMNS